jgi:predicted Rossmann-fold nucleotide-binding protein
VRSLPAERYPVVADLEELTERLPDLRDSFIVGVDLREAAIDWRQADVADAVFGGCEIEPAVIDDLRAGGAAVLSPLHQLGFDPYRAVLYTNEELMSGYVEGRPETTLDARIGAQCVGSPGPLPTLGRGIHDACIDAALVRFLATVDRPVVGVMGSHGVPRGSRDYREVAELGRLLTRGGFVVATGGGPGLMEAANLGSWLADAPDDALPHALEILVRTPTYDVDRAAFLERALEVRARWPDGSTSLGVPTWIYVDEPLNQFSTHIAKYFQNSIRENGLLAIALGGVVYTTGGSGTLQELFTDAAQNDYTLYDVRSPMVLMGAAYREGEQAGVVSVLRTLAEHRGWDHLIRVVEDAPSAFEAIRALVPEQLVAPQPPLRRR